MLDYKVLTLSTDEARDEDPIPLYGRVLQVQRLPASLDPLTVRWGSKTEDADELSEGEVVWFDEPFEILFLTHDAAEDGEIRLWTTVAGGRLGAGDAAGNRLMDLIETALIEDEIILWRGEDDPLDPFIVDTRGVGRMVAIFDNSGTYKYRPWDPDRGAVVAGSSESTFVNEQIEDVAWPWYRVTPDPAASSNFNFSLVRLP